jgi:hypothetical protein
MIIKDCLKYIWKTYCLLNYVIIEYEKKDMDTHKVHVVPENL